MNTSTHRVRLPSRSRLAAAAAMLLVTASIVGTSSGAAYAAKPKPPKPTPVPTIAPTPFVYPTPGPSVVSPSVPVPTAYQVTYGAPDDFRIQISPSTPLGDAELISGPNVGGLAKAVLGYDIGVAFYGLVENSDYVFRYRNKIYVEATASHIVSPWVTFSFHTPTFASLLPAAPQNLRVVERTATTVTVRWDAVPTAVNYDYTLNGGPSTRSGTCGGPYCIPPDPLTATFALSAPGSVVLFSVTASRAPANCAYCEEFNRFITSLPTTLVVTN